MGPESRERDVVREIKKKYDNARRVLLSSTVHLLQSLAMRQGVVRVALEAPHPSGSFSPLPQQSAR